ncbi:MAG: multi-sensor hybrid histidine kinase [Caulobacter sp.]|nr:multi-sensor hybrid histidine kinase [Caulobacter sp.]
MPSATILVIDDDPLMRAIAGEILMGAGYTVLEAEDGAAGMATLDVAPVDLIITDMLMPEMDGVESIMTIRRKRPATPVIAISAGAKHQPAGDLLRLASALGANATLSKPVRQGELLALVGQLLDQARLGPSPALRSAG